MTTKHRMARSTKWLLWITGAAGLAAIMGVTTWVQHTMGPVPGQRPHATLILQLFMGGIWVIIWAMYGLSLARQERRKAAWEAGAQARREARIRDQMARMDELHRLTGKYGQDVGTAAFLLGEDPEEVKRVCS